MFDVWVELDFCDLKVKLDCELVSITYSSTVAPLASADASKLTRSVDSFNGRSEVTFAGNSSRSNCDGNGVRGQTNPFIRY